MARNGSGTFLTPNTFVADTPIVAADHNENWTDAAAEITNSLALDGQSTMTGQIKAANGTSGAPGISFGSDTDLGIFRDSANTLGITASGGVKLNGFQVVPLLASGTFAGASQQTIVLTTFTGYRGFRFVLTDVATTADTVLALQTSTNAGVAYDSGVADYAYIGTVVTNNSASVTISDDDDNSSIFLCSTTNSAGDICSVDVTLYSPSTAAKKLVKFEACCLFDTANLSFTAGAGCRQTAADVDAVRFFPVSGTFTGAYAVFGIP